jgi:glycosyltransferase involved in cell wall biosynthesis
MQSKKENKKIKLGFLVSHPIQYQAPLFKEIAKQQGIDFKVLFFSDKSLRPNLDKHFNQIIKWDIPLLDGYAHEFLPSIGSKEQISFWRPFNYGLIKRLKTERFDALIMHGYDHKNCIHAILSAKKLGIKTLMRGESNLISAPRGPLKLFLKMKILKWLFSKIDGFLAIGSLNKDYYINYGVSGNKIIKMPYAVDNRSFQKSISIAQHIREDFRSSLCLEKGRPIILYAGKLQARKHPMDLLEAYIRLSNNDKQEPSPYLLFVGDGEQRQRLEKRAQQTGWSSIRFLGFQNQTQLPAFMELCDVFVLPATHEPWGLIVNEVMNAGKPIIVSDQVGCGPDLIEDGKNGFIFPARNISALTNSLHKTFQNPDLAREMGAKSFEKINSWGFKEDIAGLRKALEKII